MTEMLDRAFQQASNLPEDEQNEFAAFMLDELKAEKKWSELLSESQSELAKLAGEARQEFTAGETKPFQPAAK
jgi:hypothetical protein